MQAEFLSITQLSKRWSVSRERVMAMVVHGLIPGAVVIPSAGRFGKTIKIPFKDVVELEANWQVGSNLPTANSRLPKRRAVTPRLEHFPELLSD